MPNSRQEREQHEQERLDSIKEYIDYMAQVFSRDAPYEADDIAQESRIAVLKKLRADPHCPDEHLKRTAKTGIYHYRVRGRSVDGLLDDRRRTRSYPVTSIQEPLTEDGFTLEKVLSETSWPKRITEERALNRTQLDELWSQLSAKERQVLSMRLNDATWKEVIEELGYSAGERGGYTRRRIEEVVERALTAETPSANGRNGGGRSL